MGKLAGLWTSLLSTWVLAAGCSAPVDEITTGSATEQLAVSALDAVNAGLAARAAPYRVGKAEYITAPGSGEYGATVFARDVGNRRLPFQFAPGLTFVPGALVYAVDRGDGAATGGLGSADTEGAIDRAMATWGRVGCAPLTMVENVDAGGTDLGFVQAILGFGGSFDHVGEIVHAGWMPGAFFDQLTPGGGSFILGVTFTLLWTDADGNLVDTDGDGRADSALAEIYYNNAFGWTDQVVDFTSPVVDVETVALHEAGHGLSQAHFGRVFFDGRGSRTGELDHLHFTPRAVMNALYWDTQRAPLTTDVAGHCASWANWEH